MPSESHAVRKTIEVAAARARIKLDVRFEVDSIESVFQLVHDGVGHTIAKQLAALDLKSARRLAIQHIVAPALTSELSLVTPLQRSLTALQARAAELARENLSCPALGNLAADDVGESTQATLTAAH